MPGSSSAISTLRLRMNPHTTQYRNKQRCLRHLHQAPVTLFMHLHEIILNGIRRYEWDIGLMFA
jgi:hypothetical protein